MKISPKRAEYLSIAGLVLSIVFSAVIAVVGWASKSFATFAAGWQLATATIVWFVLLLQFHLRSLAERERLDLAQLARTGDENTIFEAEQEQKSLFAVSQRRLALFEKWFLPIFALIIGLYEVGIGGMLIRRADAVEAVRQPLVSLAYMWCIAFVLFLLSRYATGMSSETEWKPLRAGGGFLAVSAVICFVLGLGYGLAQFKHPGVLETMDVVIPAVMIVLGIETVLNIVFDMYRPRIAGRYWRAAFDSRLLSLVNEPGQILSTFTGTLDYQFGFKVSQTWFYKLLAKAILPLILFSALTLYLLSCIVVVNADESAIIEHFGKPKNGGEPVGPGLTFKWPWPIDVAYTYPTQKIQTLNIGFKVAEEGKVSREPLLWNMSHYKEEYNLLVANNASQGGVASFSIIVAAMPVQFKVKDLHQFLYNYGFRKNDMGTSQEPVAISVLEDICYRELVKYTISSNSGGQGMTVFEGLRLLGVDRQEAAETLKKVIQEKADKAGLGVEVVFLALQVHPPKDVATEYEDVVGAVLDKRVAILDAIAERNDTLSTLAGSVRTADMLDGLLKQNADASSLDKGFETAAGDIFAMLSQSRSQAYEKATLAKATGERFQGQLQAYRAAPQIYKRELRLATLEEISPSLRKYVLVTDPADKKVTIIDLTQKMESSLLDYDPGQGK